MCHLPDHWSLCLGLSTSFWPDILYDPVTQVAIYGILRSRGLRVVLSASLFVAFLVATQLSVKIVESKPFNFRPESWSQVVDKSRNLVMVACRFPGLLTTLHFSCVVVAVSASPGLLQDMTGCFQFLRPRSHFALRTPSFKERCFIWFVQCPITNKVLDMDGRATQDLSLVHSATAMGEEPGWQIQLTHPSTSSQPPLLHAVGDDNLSFSKDRRSSCN